jgi:hypothetical protein
MDAIKHFVGDKFGVFEELTSQWRSVLALHSLRLDEAAKQGSLVK